MLPHGSPERLRMAVLIPERGRDDKFLAVNTLLASASYLLFQMNSVVPNYFVTSESGTIAMK